MSVPYSNKLEYGVLIVMQECNAQLIAGSRCSLKGGEGGRKGGGGRGEGRYLLTGCWEFIRLSGQVGQIL